MKEGDIVIIKELEDVEPSYYLEFTDNMRKYIGKEFEIERINNENEIVLKSNDIEDDYNSDSKYIGDFSWDPEWLVLKIDYDNYTKTSKSLKFKMQNSIRLFCNNSCIWGSNNCSNKDCPLYEYRGNENI